MRTKRLARVEPFVRTWLGPPCEGSFPGGGGRCAHFCGSAALYLSAFPNLVQQLYTAL